MSRVLLDTHLLLWWLKDDPRLPDVLVSELQTDRHTVWISQVSLWELAINVNLGGLHVDLTALERLVPKQGFQWLKISNDHLLEVARLEPIDGHRDPFDRLLVCQSRVEPLLLFTCDQALAAYGSCVRVFG